MDPTTPFAYTRWQLVPRRTAVVIIDPQNDFLHLEGWYARRGIDIGHMRRSIEPITRLVGEARSRNLPII